MPVRSTIAITLLLLVLGGGCRLLSDDAQASPACGRALDRATQVAAGQALQTRMAFWSTQVHIAQRATAGDAPGTRQAVDRWGDLLSTYEDQLTRMDRVNGRLQRATLGCRDEL